MTDQLVICPRCNGTCAEPKSGSIDACRGCGGRGMAPAPRDRRPAYDRAPTDHEQDRLFNFPRGIPGQQTLDLTPAEDRAPTDRRSP